MIHGAIAAVLLLTAYFFQDARKKNDGIFEVVAGEGDNWAATEAPAPGQPDAPAAPDTLTFTPTPATPAPATVPETPPEPVQAQSPVSPATTTPPNALVVPTAKATKPATKKNDARQTPKQSASQTMSIDEFNKRYGAKNKNAPSGKALVKTAASTSAAPPGKAVAAQQITSPGKGLLAGVAGGTGSAPGAGGDALTAAERDQMDAYFATLAERLKQALEKPEGMSMALVTRVEYYVGADGTIGAVKIIRSSGNRAFDDAVLKAFRSVRPIGPRPDGRGGAKIANLRMKEE
jgi:colicin import membrane protein